MKVITLLNEKGGVGKTTLATHIAAGLAIKGATVVLIDADPQGNASSAVGLPMGPQFYDLAVREAAWNDSLRIVHPDVYGEPDREPEGRLFAVPGNVETRNVPTTTSDDTVFVRRFNELASLVDYVVVDTSPSPSLMHPRLAAASDYVLIPTQCEADSVNGVYQTMQHIHNVRTSMVKQGFDVARIAGIVPMMYRRKTIAHNEMLKGLRAQYGDRVIEPVSMQIAFGEARMLNQMIYGYQPEGAAAADMWRMVDVVTELETIR